MSYNFVGDNESLENRPPRQPLKVCTAVGVHVHILAHRLSYEPVLLLQLYAELVHQNPYLWCSQRCDYDDWCCTAVLRIGHRMKKRALRKAGLYFNLQDSNKFGNRHTEISAEHTHS